MSKTGKKYINEILGEEVTQGQAATAVATKHVTAAAPAQTAVVTETAKAAAPKASGNPTRAGFGQQLTDYDVAIQRQISRRLGRISGRIEFPLPLHNGL